LTTFDVTMNESCPVRCARLVAPRLSPALCRGLCFAWRYSENYDDPAQGAAARKPISSRQVHSGGREEKNEGRRAGDMPAILQPVSASCSNYSGPGSDNLNVVRWTTGKVPRSSGCDHVELLSESHMNSMRLPGLSRTKTSTHTHLWATSVRVTFRDQPIPTDPQRSQSSSSTGPREQLSDSQEG